MVFGGPGSELGVAPGTVGPAEGAIGGLGAGRPADGNSCEKIEKVTVEVEVKVEVEVEAVVDDGGEGRAEGIVVVGMVGVEMVGAEIVGAAYDGPTTGVGVGVVDAPSPWTGGSERVTPTPLHTFVAMPATAGGTVSHGSA